MLFASEVAKGAARLEFPQNAWSLKCKNIGREQISPKFPKSWHLWGVMGQEILGKFDPCRCFSHLRLLKCCQARISPKCLKPEMRKHRQGTNFPKIPKILASMGSDGARNFGEIWSLPMFSHPRLLNSRQARISPKISEAWNAKTSAGIKFPQNSQNPGIYGEWWGKKFWGNLIPADVFAS